MGWGNIGSIAGGLGGAFFGGPAGAALGSGVGGSIGGEFDSQKDPYTSHLKHGVRWRVEDARRAGVHPLAALGASIGSPIVNTTGSTTGDGAAVAGAFREYGRQSDARESREIARKQSESAIRVNETQAQLNEARSRSIIAEMQQNPAISAQLLDMSMVVNPMTNRVEMVNTPAGWHKLDTKTVPTRVMEDEYGEIGEMVYGPSRYAHTSARNYSEPTSYEDAMTRLRLKYNFNP